MDSRSASRQEADDEREDPFGVPGIFGFVVVMHILAVEAYHGETEDELEETEGGDKHTHCFGTFAGGFGGG